MNCSVVTHHNTAWCRSQRATSRCTPGSCFRLRPRRRGKGVPGTPGATLVSSVLPLQPDQEAVSQHHCGGVAVEAPPAPTLVLVPAQLSLGLFMELLNSIAAMGILHQFLQWSSGRQVAPVVLVLSWLTSGRSFPKQPTFSYSPIPGAPPAVQGDELLPEPALAPLPPPDGAPQASRQGSQHLVGPASWGPGRQAHSKVGPDSYHIGFPTLLQPSQEVGIVAVVGIGDHTVVGYSPTPRLVQQGQGNLGLGLEAYFRRYACFATPLQVLGPSLGQIQAHPHWPGGQGVAVAAGDCHLRVAHLAQGARVLAAHPH